MEGLPASVTASLYALIEQQRELAYLQIDATQRLVGAGGHLTRYGLGSIQLGRPASEQVFFLEGLLPMAETPFFIRSMEVGDRAADLQFYLDGDDLWVLLLDVTAERDDARRMQQRAYDMTLLRESEAAWNRRLEAANAELRATQSALEHSRAALETAHTQLQDQLAEAARYMRSLLPDPMSQPFHADWRYVPSEALGGDALGYHWIDSDHFALYLLDVCGHGVGPSLLSVAVLQMLRSASLPGIDFRHPTQVLSALNRTYQMQNDKDLYFTLWYGVYQPATRTLEYGCAGHPAALLMAPDGAAVTPLKTKGVAIGLAEGVIYERGQVTVPTGSRLYLISDGTFEVQKPDGTLLASRELTEFLRQARPGSLEMDDWLEHLRQLRGAPVLEDDFSMARFDF
jgi:sigma-B regulation protein RsbU (phosphoserine phosphatase)